MAERSPFRWRRGVMAVRLADAQRALLRQVIDEYRQMLSAGDDPALGRLSPPAHPDDPEAEAAFRQMIDADLEAQRTEALGLIERTIDSDELDEEAVSAWTRTINGCRLVLGSRLDIDVLGHQQFDDLADDDPRMGLLAVYEWLGHLLEALVDAAQEGLDDTP